jgi:hypothetical protein
LRFFGKNGRKKLQKSDLRSKFDAVFTVTIWRKICRETRRQDQFSIEITVLYENSTRNMSGGDNSNAASAASSYPELDATSPTDSVIQGDFGTLSAEEQEHQRDEWKAELSKTEEEVITLKQV